MNDHELLVELRDIKQRIAALICEVSERIEREDRTFERIMKEVRESDELQMRMGRRAPNDLPVAPDFEAQTHDVYVPLEDVEEIERCGE